MFENRSRKSEQIKLTWRQMKWVWSANNNSSFSKQLQEDNRQLFWSENCNEVPQEEDGRLAYETGGKGVPYNDFLLAG